MRKIDSGLMGLDKNRERGKRMKIRSGLGSGGLSMKGK